jgi:hypothetical protein
MLISKPTKKCKTVIKISLTQGSKGSRMDCLNVIFAGFAAYDAKLPENCSEKRKRYLYKCL